MRQFFKYNIWGILWGLLILILTTLPAKVFPRVPSFLDVLHPDKLVHISIFTVYFYVQARGFFLQNRFLHLQKQAVLTTLLIGLFLGAATEIIQEYCTLSRSGDIFDFLADATGCLIGLWIFYIWRARAGKRTKDGF